jgi:hypothetical protein
MDINVCYFRERVNVMRCEDLREATGPGLRQIRSRSSRDIDPSVLRSIGSVILALPHKTFSDFSNVLELKPFDQQRDYSSTVAHHVSRIGREVELPVHSSTPQH